MINFTEMWDSRFGEDGYAYGKEPNVYFAKKIKSIKPGKILLPAEGEGRNAVYAARLGWDVNAVDISENAKVKALNLAKEFNVKIDYHVRSFEEIEFPKNFYDAIGLVYTHFSREQTAKYFEIFKESLISGGYIIFEGFSKSHLEINRQNKYSMGPQKIDLLYSIDEIKNYFKGYDFLELSEDNITLDEGKYHKGKGTVIRFLAKKSAV